jgi:hypothetical protein
MCILVVTKQQSTNHQIGVQKPSFISAKITKISSTNDKISARGGLPFFLRYVGQTGLYTLISSSITPFFTQGNKGLQLQGFIKQLLAFFIDGTDMSMTGFDQRKEDEGYAALLEYDTGQLASSHQIKRYFGKLSIIGNVAYNKILNELFIWRLNIENPKIIELGIDTMVLDNDSAQKREGNEPTCKLKKGFQPLHICWGPFLIDVMFRKGGAHSNHGTDYTDRVRAIVKLVPNVIVPKSPSFYAPTAGLPTKKHMWFLKKNFIYTTSLRGSCTPMSRPMLVNSPKMALVKSQRTKPYGGILNLLAS